MNTSDLLNRIDELEIRSQFQEETIDALNSALTHQQQDILLLKEQIKLLAKRLEDQRDNSSSGINGTIEKPPHY
ncbi:Protein SlyX [Marinomonas aquimarina]|uniref:Protein SlyX homolog n=1 Tax=Marinomonas aquimarina TaxID=295068 RepID=A0A1A8TM38_9GAMM|nr:SlyX family protein [Marinomonas aquimarina]SBS35039.1 Protein SlyX [Marinomonas aquimarina]